MRRLTDAYYAGAALHLRRQGELRKVLRALQAEGIAVIVLKGAALAETVYPDPALRLMEDVDLLVEEGHLARADTVIRGIGYDTMQTPHEEEVVRDRHRHYPTLVSESGFTRFEIHRHLVTANSGFHFDISECWKSARRVEIASTETSMLSPEEMLFHLCVGFFLDRRRYYPSHAALRQLVDVAETIRHHGNELDWDRFARTAVRRRASGPLYSVLAAARELLECPVPEEPLESLRPEGFDPALHGKFIERKILEVAPWFLHELVTVSDNTLPDLARSAVRRVFLPREYLTVKYWPDVESPIRLHLRHGRDVLRFVGESVRRPGRVLDHLKVDRWMHSLEASPGVGAGNRHGRR